MVRGLSAMKKTRKRGCLALTLGTLLAPIIGTILLPLVFGRISADAASAWGLAPLAHVIIAVLSVPGFWVGYGTTNAFLTNQGAERKLQVRPIYAITIGLIVYGVVTISVWQLAVGGKVMT